MLLVNPNRSAVTTASGTVHTKYANILVSYLSIVSYIIDVDVDSVIEGQRTAVIKGPLYSLLLFSLSSWDFNLPVWHFKYCVINHNLIHSVDKFEYLKHIWCYVPCIRCLKINCAVVRDVTEVILQAL